MAKSVITRFIFAAIIYCGLALCLYGPRLDSLAPIQYLLVIDSVFAAIGAFVLSRRWLYSFPASVLAGALFGFGPFALSFDCYHPTASFAFAMLPWLFCPAAFLPKSRLLSPKLTVLASATLTLLPILITILFFEIARDYSLVPIPLKTKLNCPSLYAFITPLTQPPQNFLLSLYHIPAPALLMGLVMFFKVRRFGITTIFIATVFLICCRPIFNVPPVFWTSIVVLYCAIIIGAGLEGLTLAGSGDSKWILTAGVFSAILALVTLSLGLGFDKTYLDAAKMHSLGALAVFIIFFITRASASLHWLRLLIFISAIIADVLITSAIIINSIF